MSTLFAYIKFKMSNFKMSKFKNTKICNIHSFCIIQINTEFNWFPTHCLFLPTLYCILTYRFKIKMPEEDVCDDSVILIEYINKCYFGYRVLDPTNTECKLCFGVNKTIRSSPSSYRTSILHWISGPHHLWSPIAPHDSVWCLRWTVCHLGLCEGAEWNALTDCMRASTVCGCMFTLSTHCRCCGCTQAGCFSLKRCRTVDHTRSPPVTLDCCFLSTFKHTCEIHAK